MEAGAVPGGDRSVGSAGYLLDVSLVFDTAAARIKTSFNLMETYLNPSKTSLKHIKTLLTFISNLMKP